MSVIACDVPPMSVMGKDLVERASFRDAHRVPLGRPDLGVADIFLGIFAYRPTWMKLILIARNKTAGLAGLDVPATSEIMKVEMKDNYAVGEKIGAWPIHFLGADELVAGRDNSHMDLRGP
jgi:Protein of unknown function (DUF2867)